MLGTSGRYGDAHMGSAWTAHASKGDGTWFPQAGVGHWNYEYFLNAYVSTMNMAAVCILIPLLLSDTG